MNVYDIGDVIRLSVIFQNSNGVDTDPTVTKVDVKTPAGVVTTYEIPAVVKDATGRFHYDLVIAESGIYHYRWFGTGTVTAAGQSSFDIRKSLQA